MVLYISIPSICLGGRSRLSVAIAAVVAVGLGSCASSSAPPNAAAPNADSPQAATTSAAPELQVVTTFVPMTQFTKAVVGDRAQVTQLMPPSVGPHDYQAKPADAQTLARADVLVKNGLEVEAFLDDLVQNAGNANLKVIDSSAGVQTISNEEVEGHDHAEGHAHNHAEEKAGAQPAGEVSGHHHHGEFNPHIWIDPKRAIQQVENIRDGLIAADPAGKDTYNANAAAYIAELKTLDAEIAAALKPFAGKTFVVLHDFAPYFAQSYGLKAQFLVDVPDENPSPEDVKRVIETVKDTNLKTLLTEPQAGENAFASLAKDLNVQVSQFDPMETAGSDGMEPQYYLTTMRQNLRNLETAFSVQPAQTFLPGSVLRMAIAPTLPQRMATLPQPVSFR